MKPTDLIPKRSGSRLRFDCVADCESESVEVELVRALPNLLDPSVILPILHLHPQLALVAAVSELGGKVVGVLTK